MKKRVYIGSYVYRLGKGTPSGSKGVYTGTYDTESGEVTLTGCAVNADGDPAVINPSFLAISGDEKLLAAASEQQGTSGIYLFEIGEDGSLTPADHVDFAGDDCCFVAIGPKNGFVCANNYSSGDLLVYELEGDRIGEQKFFRHYEGHGPNAARQESAHIHSCRLMEAVSRLVACDLGTDQVYFYHYEADGTLTEDTVPTIKVPGGLGPRHTEFTADGKRLYVSCEMGNEVLFYELAEEGGAASYVLRQRISTLPEGYEGRSTVSDIHFGPEGTELYVANRGHDSIARFAVAADGTLSAAGFVSAGGPTPRNFAVTERHILVAVQDGDRIAVMERDADMGGAPVAVCPVPSPSFIEVR